MKLKRTQSSTSKRNDITTITKQASTSSFESSQSINNKSFNSLLNARKKNIIAFSPLHQRSKSHHFNTVNEEQNEDDSNSEHNDLSPQTKAVVMGLIGKTKCKEFAEFQDEFDEDNFNLDLNDSEFNCFFMYQNEQNNFNPNNNCGVAFNIPTIYNRILKHEEMNKNECFNNN